MHQQIVTSPGRTGENIRHVADALAAAGISIEGIGPDFEAPHVRTVVRHKDTWPAYDALKAAHLEPEIRPAIAFAVPPNAPGAVRAILDDLAREGYTAESILVLASRPDPEHVLVSIGVRQTVPDGWEARAIELGGWEEPDEWLEGALE